MKLVHIGQHTLLALPEGALLADIAQAALCILKHFCIFRSIAVSIGKIQLTKKRGVKLSLTALCLAESFRRVLLLSLQLGKAFESRLMSVQQLIDLVHAFAAVLCKYVIAHILGFFCLFYRNDKYKSFPLRI